MIKMLFYICLQLIKFNIKRNKHILYMVLPFIVFVFLVFEQFKFFNTYDLRFVNKQVNGLSIIFNKYSDIVCLYTLVVRFKNVTIFFLFIADEINEKKQFSGNIDLHDID